MTPLKRHLVTLIAAVALVPAQAQTQQAAQVSLKTAEVEVPRLVELLQLQSGMTVADVGAGSGAWSIVFSRWLGPSGLVYATDIGATQLAGLREAVAREGLGNITVLEGAAGSTNLPPLCCDAMLIRDAYHHFTQPEDMLRSITASLKPGGRLAIIDFPPNPSSTVPQGVPANRGGHGVPSGVVEREVSAWLKPVQTIAEWSPRQNLPPLFLILFQKSEK